MENMVASIRWVSILGIISWFPKRYRSEVPAVSIVVVGIFVNATVFVVGIIGLFTQLAVGFSFLMVPRFEPNWLFTKDAWWFFGHPIVYFTLFSFLGEHIITSHDMPRKQYHMINGHTDRGHFILSLLCWYSPIMFTWICPTLYGFRCFHKLRALVLYFHQVLHEHLMMYLFRSRIKWNISSMFLLADIVGWTFAGLAGAETGWWVLIETCITH